MKIIAKTEVKDLKDSDVIKIVDSEDHTNVVFEGTLKDAKEWMWNYNVVEYGYKMGWAIQK